MLLVGATGKTSDRRRTVVYYTQVLRSHFRIFKPQFIKSATMTPRSLLIIILRVLGIILLRALVLSVTELVSSVWYMFYYGISGTDVLFGIFITLIYILIVLALGYWLIFKTEILIDKFGLDKGFSEPVFQFNINSRSIIQMGLIITGAVILFWELPGLVKNIYTAWQQNYMTRLTIPAKTDWSPVSVSVVRIILALLIIGERKRICQFLVKEQASEPLKQDTNSDLPA